MDRYHVAGYSLGARVAIHLAETDRVRSVVAIAPDGLGTPLERVQGYVALTAGRAMAIGLAPAAEPLSWTPAGRSVFFAGNRSLPWQLETADAQQLLTDFAGSPATTPRTGTPCSTCRPTCTPSPRPPCSCRAPHDPLMAQQVARYLALIPEAKLRWLPGPNHVPISDDPTVVARHMLTFLRQHAMTLTATR